MSKLKLTITMSIDGFVAGPDQSPEHPLGIGGEELHGWLVPLRAFRESHGDEGGEVNASTPFAEDILGGAGATIMGRNMFGGGPGPWDESWKGWWGDDPPYHHPVFVVTSHPREPLVMQGGTTFHFVTDGIESALEQARAAAGEKDVSLGGGASVAQQYLAAGLLDELVVSVVPILLGSGARLFENVGDLKLGGPASRTLESFTRSSTFVADITALSASVAPRKTRSAYAPGSTYSRGPASSSRPKSSSSPRRRAISDEFAPDRLRDAYTMPTSTSPHMELGAEGFPVNGVPHDALAGWSRQV
jgi:dihydrofolate reductase